MPSLRHHPHHINPAPKQPAEVAKVILQGSVFDPKTIAHWLGDFLCAAQPKSQWVALTAAATAIEAQATTLGEQNTPPPPYLLCHPGLLPPDPVSTADNVCAAYTKRKHVWGVVEAAAWAWQFIDACAPACIGHHDQRVEFALRAAQHLRMLRRGVPKTDAVKPTSKATSKRTSPKKATTKKPAAKPKQTRRSDF